MFQELGSSLYMGKDAAGTPRCFTGSRLQRTFVAGIVFPNGESSLHLPCLISYTSCVYSLHGFRINKGLFINDVITFGGCPDPPPLSFVMMSSLGLVCVNGEKN